MQVGDTITRVDQPCPPLPGYRAMQPMVFAGVYPVDTEDFVALREALEKLTLNDASLVFEPESSAALGSGFRCGFLGPLHSEIVLERLRREYDLDLIATVPNVGYRVTTPAGETIEVHNPSQMPVLERHATVAEPFVKAKIVMPPTQSAPSRNSARTFAVFTREWSTWKRTVSSCPTSCRWRRSSRTSTTV